MCPACIASAMLVAGGLMTGGGVAALVIKLSRSKQTGNESHLEKSNEKEK
jgi:hypothetical protein